LAAIEQREEAFRRMGIEIRDSAHAGKDEGNGSREQADDEKHAADELKQARKTAHRKRRGVVHGTHGEIQVLRRAMLKQQKARHEPEHAEKVRLIGSKEFHWHLIFSSACALTVRLG